MQIILILKGAPASGKTSYCRELIKQEPGKWQRVSKDALRECLGFGEYSVESEAIVHNTQSSIIRNALQKGFNVVVDSVNSDSKAFKEACKIAKELNINVEILEKTFYVPLNELILRDSVREGKARVGEEVIRKFWTKLQGEKFKNYVPMREVSIEVEQAIKYNITEAIQNEQAPKAIICDIDGSYLKIGNRSPYDATKSLEVDKPNWPVINTIRLYYDAGYKIIFCTGREQKYEAITRSFIEKYSPNMEYVIFTRKDGDFRKDSVVKEEIYHNCIEDKYNIEFIMDDRSMVVSAWRSLGLTCFQVAPGDF